MPALVIGCGSRNDPLCPARKNGQPLNYVVLVVTILAMSAFLLHHYLTVYYLLQPYTAGTEMKGTYRIVMVLTYVVCYAMINVRMPILMFGAMCIAFCVAYSIVASILVYMFAPPDLPATDVI